MLAETGAGANIGPSAAGAAFDGKVTMRRTVIALAALATLVLGGTGPVSAQGAAAATSPKAEAAPPAARTARPKREPTAGQMAARERQRKCGAEWREAKTSGKTGGLKWPQYWSRCNARLKGNAA